MNRKIKIIAFLLVTFFVTININGVTVKAEDARLTELITKTGGFYNGFNYKILNTEKTEVAIINYLIDEAETVNYPSEIKGMKVVSISNVNPLLNAKKITIPSTVKTIPNQAFGGYFSLEEIEFPDSVENIAINVFSSCTNLKSITIPKGVILDEGTFAGCSKSVIVHGATGSDAEKFAKEYKLEFVPFDYIKVPTPTPTVENKEDTTTPPNNNKDETISDPVGTGTIEPIASSSVSTTTPVPTTTPAITGDVNSITTIITLFSGMASLYIFKKKK